MGCPGTVAAATAFGAERELDRRTARAASGDGSLDGKVGSHLIVSGQRTRIWMPS